nr:hypothetical protein Iba_chr12aCG20950 [Ipomoea batatas]
MPPPPTLAVVAPPTTHARCDDAVLFHALTAAVKRRLAVAGEGLRREGDHGSLPGEEKVGSDRLLLPSSPGELFTPSEVRGNQHHHLHLPRRRGVRRGENGEKTSRSCTPPTEPRSLSPREKQRSSTHAVFPLSSREKGKAAKQVRTHAGRDEGEGDAVRLLRRGGGVPFGRTREKLVATVDRGGKPGGKTAAAARSRPPPTLAVVAPPTHMLAGDPRTLPRSNSASSSPCCCGEGLVGREDHGFLCVDEGAKAKKEVGESFRVHGGVVAVTLRGRDESREGYDRAEKIELSFPFRLLLELPLHVLAAAMLETEEMDTAFAEARCFVAAGGRAKDAAVGRTVIVDERGCQSLLLRSLQAAGWRKTQNREGRGRAATWSKEEDTKIQGGDGRKW